MTRAHRYCRIPRRKARRRPAGTATFYRSYSCLLPGYSFSVAGLFRPSISYQWHDCSGADGVYRGHPSLRRFEPHCGHRCYWNYPASVPRTWSPRLKQLKLAAATNVKAVILRTDSPGGEVMADEIARAIREFETDNGQLLPQWWHGRQRRYYVAAPCRYILQTNSPSPVPSGSSCSPLTCMGYWIKSASNRSPSRAAPTRTCLA